MKILNKAGLAALVTTTVAVALAPQTALADKHNTRGSNAAATSPIQADLERRLQMMEDEMRTLRSELSRTRRDAQTTADKMEAHQQQAEQHVADMSAKDESRDDLIFFRGGFASMEHPRANELLMDNNVLGGTNDAKNGNGWYVGAGFDHRLTDNLWGMTDMVALDGEVMFEYKNFGSSHNALVDAVGTTLAGSAVHIENQLTQFTLTAAPKIKLNNLGDFRPWIIPFGLGIHVISPPSSGVTVLNPGLMVGTGAEYKIWKDIYAGLDFRYHFTGDDLAYKSRLPNGSTLLNRTRIDGLTTGAYLGFGF